MTTDKAAAFLYYWRLYIQDTLPEPDAEYRFMLGRKFRFDFAWPGCKLAVEVDGGQWLPHGGRHMRDSDREKLNFAAMQGWRVMHFSPQELERDPVGCLKMVAEAYHLEVTA